MKHKSIYKSTALLLSAVVGASSFTGVAKAQTNLPSDFNDVPSYAKSTIEAMYGQNKLSGFSDGTFRPNQELTRVEFVAMLLRAYDFKNDEYLADEYVEGRLIFTDEAKMSQFQKNVMIQAYFVGLIGGTESTDEYDEEGNFIATKVKLDPNKTITRQEMAAILMNAQNEATASTYLHEDLIDDILSESFSGDKEKIASWATEAVALAKYYGLMSGTSSTEFTPKKVGTRVEAALLFNRLENQIIQVNTFPDSLTTKERQTFDEFLLENNVSKSPYFQNLSFVSEINQGSDIQSTDTYTITTEEDEEITFNYYTIKGVITLEDGTTNEFHHFINDFRSLNYTDAQVAELIANNPDDFYEDEISISADTNLDEFLATLKQQTIDAYLEYYEELDGFDGDVELYIEHFGELDEEGDEYIYFIPTQANLLVIYDDSYNIIKKIPVVKEARE